MNIHHHPVVIHCLIEPCVVLLLPGLAHSLCQNRLGCLHLRGTESSLCTTGMSGALQGPDPRPGRTMTLFIMFPEESWFLPTQLLDSSSENKPKIVLGLFFLEIWPSKIPINTEWSTANIYRALWCKHQVNTGWQADCIIHILQNSLICMSFTRKSLWSSIVQIIQVTWTHHTHTLISKVKMTRREKPRERKYNMERNSSWFCNNKETSCSDQ